MARLIPDRILLRQGLSASLTNGLQGGAQPRWKYIHYLELEGMDELYDLKTDPYEMKT